MNIFKVLTVLLITMGLAISFNSCGPTETGPIQIGVLLPLTGAQANFGEMEKNSFEMAKDEINNAGGINGRNLEFIYEDDTGKPDVGRAGAEKLISINKVPMLAGGYSSSVTFATAAVAQQNRVPFLVNTGSVDKITQPEDFNLTTADADKFYIYRLNPPVSEYASGLEGMLSEVIKPSTVYIIHENTTFGTKGAGAFQETCAKLNLKVLGTDSYSSGTVDFKPLLLNAQKTNPDVLYMISYVMDAALLMKQSRDLKFYPNMFVGAGAGFTMPAFKENAGKASEMVVSATLWHQTLPIPGATKYYDDYVLKYGGDGPDYHGAEAYAAAYVIKDALERCDGKYDSETIKKALDETDIMTAFGPVKFQAYDNKIHQNKMDTYVVQWINGEMKLIWPKELANAEISYPIIWEEVWAN